MDVKAPRMVRVLFVAASAVATLLGACHHDAPHASAALETLPPPPRELSHFDAPIQYDFTPVLGIVDRVVPRTFGALDSLHSIGGDPHKQYAYQATRGPFTAFADGPMVHLRATLSYAARGFYKPPIGPTLSAGCGDGSQRPRLIIELATPITLTPDWHLRSNAQLVRMVPASSSDGDRCTVTIIHFDVTDRVVDAARHALVSHLPDIDHKIADVDLRPQFASWWGLLQRPIQLTDGVWLLLHPDRLRMGHVTGVGHVLTVQAGLDAYPEIVTGTEPHPQTATSPELPPLAHDTVSGGFHVLLQGVVDYAAASRGVTSALQGRTVTEAGRSVTMRAASILPEPGGRVALVVLFTGDAHGRLRFVGTPRYDAVHGRIAVPDLDYDLQTDNDLINAYAWLRSDALRTLFREHAQVPVAPVLDSAKVLLLRGLNRKIGDAVTLTATVDSVAVRGIYVTAPGLVVRAEATGAAAMSVRQQGEH